MSAPNFTYTNREGLTLAVRVLRRADVPSFVLCETVGGDKQLMLHRVALRCDGQAAPAQVIDAVLAELGGNAS